MARLRLEEASAAWRLEVHRCHDEGAKLRTKQPKMQGWLTMARREAPEARRGAWAREQELSALQAQVSSRDAELAHLRGEVQRLGAKPIRAHEGA